MPTIGTPDRAPSLELPGFFRVRWARVAALHHPGAPCCHLNSNMLFGYYSALH